jgi:hypothetical protein
VTPDATASPTPSPSPSPSPTEGPCVCIEFSHNSSGTRYYGYDDCSGVPQTGTTYTQGTFSVCGSGQNITVSDPKLSYSIGSDCVGGNCPPPPPTPSATPQPNLYWFDATPGIGNCDSEVNEQTFHQVYWADPDGLGGNGSEANYLPPSGEQLYSDSSGTLYYQSPSGIRAVTQPGTYDLFTMYISSLGIVGYSEECSDQSQSLEIGPTPTPTK